MALDGLGVTRKRDTRDVHNYNRPNRPYDPTRQVSADDMIAARATLAEMLAGGDLLASFEGPYLEGAVTVLDRSIAAANVRLSRLGTQIGTP